MRIHYWSFQFPFLVRRRLPQNLVNQTPWKSIVRRSASCLQHNFTSISIFLVLLAFHFQHPRLQSSNTLELFRHPAHLLMPVVRWLLRVLTMEPTLLRDHYAARYVNSIKAKYVKLRNFSATIRRLLIRANFKIGKDDCCAFKLKVSTFKLTELLNCSRPNWRVSMFCSF